MGKREKILLALMIVSIAYGGFELFYPSGRTGEESTSMVDLQTAEHMGQQVNKEVKAAELTEQQRYVLEAAAENRQGDFVQALPRLDPAERENVLPDTTQKGFEYTGYLEAGERRIAIINGMEYEVGETLIPDGGVLLRITPDSVVIEARQNNGSVVVPYSE